MKCLLWEIAHGRSGDKGDTCNIGIIARRPEHYPVLLREVTVERVRVLFDDWCLGPIERYELNNICGLNFVLHRALDGGALRSLRLDRQGKTYAAAVLRMEIDLG
jgi:hypothetical protein